MQRAKPIRFGEVLVVERDGAGREGGLGSVVVLLLLASSVCGTGVGV